MSGASWTHESANFGLLDGIGLIALSLRCLLSRVLSPADAGPGGAGGEEDTESGPVDDVQVGGA